MSKKTEEERKKVVDKISKHIHPHDDEPDPTAYMGNYNFPQMLLLSALDLSPCLYCQSTKSMNLKGVHSQNISKER